MDRFIPPYVPPVSLSFDNPRMFGGFFATDYFYEHRYTLQLAAQEALAYYPEVCREFTRDFGRTYDLIETYRTEDAEIILVAAGAITSVSRIAVDQMQGRGVRVGLMKLRMFRPVPVDCWRKALEKAAKVVVIDRNLSVGLGGIFASEIRSVLYGSDHRLPIYSVIAGLGGRDVTPEYVEGILNHVIAQDKPSDAPLFWGLKK